MSNHDYPHQVEGWQSDAQQLIAAGRWEEALTLWVQQTPQQALNRWLITCLRKLNCPDSAPLLEKMQHWYAQPEEKLRWQIFNDAEILGFDTPAGALALSLFWSQGSMSPEGLEPVYPEPHLSGKMSQCVLLMLATQNSDNVVASTAHLLTQWANQEKASCPNPLPA